MSSSDSGGRTVLIVFGIIAGLVLILFIGCAGVAFVAWRSFKPLFESAQQMIKDIKETQTLGRSFLSDIRDGKLDAAYGVTSPGYKQRVSRQAFEAFIKEHASLKQQLELDPDPADIIPAADPDKGTYKFQVKRSGKPEFLLRFVKENGVWTIDGLDLDESGAVEAAARSFVESVKAKWNDSAYQLTTAQFRTKWNRAALEAFLKKHPIPAGYVLEPPHDEDGEGKSFYVIIIDPKEDEEVFTILMRKDGTTWRVDDLRYDE